MSRPNKASAFSLHLFATILALAFAGQVLSSKPFPRHPDREVHFKKIVLDTRFVSEGVAIADVNRDGRLDIIAGNVWYEAPTWKGHEIAPYQQVDPAHAYSNCFNSWAYDANHDGWPDQIVIGMPGERAYWRENPKGKDQPWKEHPIWRSACDESPLFVDLFANRKPVLVMGYDDQYLAWFEPAKDPNAEWICHNISELNGAGSQRYTHGLGVGDLFRDGRREVLTTSGYYVPPKNPQVGAWTFVKADLGPECAQMGICDVNRDGLPDIVATSAHARGVWWYKQQKDRSFVKHMIDDTISESHSEVLADLKGDGNLDIVTGKRFWAHPPGVDVGSDEPAMLVWYEPVRSPSGVDWQRHTIDADSGVGTQFQVRDIDGDGLLDIITSNKKGVFLFLQQRR